MLFYIWSPDWRRKYNVALRIKLYTTGFLLGFSVGPEYVTNRESYNELWNDISNRFLRTIYYCFYLQCHCKMTSCLVCANYTPTQIVTKKFPSIQPSAILNCWQLAIASNSSLNSIFIWARWCSWKPSEQSWRLKDVKMTHLWCSAWIKQNLCCASATLPVTSLIQR